jgi:Flp pilus assembly protein TadG
MQKRRRRGNATIEFTLVGIPIVFVLISTIEMARGMWIYHTLAYAVKEGTRYAVARGQNNPTVYQSVCNAITHAGTGLLPEALTLTFTSLSGTTGPFAANTCPSAPWPPGGTGTIDNQPGQTISITGFYPFASAISMFWPGAGKGMTFTPAPPQAACSNQPGFCLPASSQDVMQF